MNTNVKRSSRLAAKELRESNREEKDGDGDSRKRGRDRDDYVNTYKRPVPSTKKSAQVTVPAPQEVSPAVPAGRAKEKAPLPVAVPANKTEQASYSPSAVVEGASAFRVGHGDGVSCTGTANGCESKDLCSVPAQRPPSMAVNTPPSKPKELPKAGRGGSAQPKPLPKPSTGSPGPSTPNRIIAPPRVPASKGPGQGEAGRDGHDHQRIAQHDLKPVSSRADVVEAVPHSRTVNDSNAATNLSAKEVQKPVRERHRGVGMNGTSSNFIGVPPAVNENLRRSLGGAVERWISARSALPGGESDDLGGFRPEIERLVKLIAFEAHESKCEVDEDERSNGDGADYEKHCSREITTTRFRLAHPQMKLPFVFESTQHIFTGSVLGSGGMGHRLENLRWKVEFELIGFFVLAFHTQTYQVDEDVELPRLDEVREALQTHITSSELGVLFMLAGNASRGPAAWNYVEDVCFWTANFSLPEFPGP